MHSWCLTSSGISQPLEDQLRPLNFMWGNSPTSVLQVDPSQWRLKAFCICPACYALSFKGCPALMLGGVPRKHPQEQ